MKLKIAGIAVALIGSMTFAADYSLSVGGGALSYDVNGHMDEGFSSAFQLTRTFSGFSAGIALDHINSQVGYLIPTTLEYWSVQAIAQVDKRLFGLPTYFSAGVGVFGDINGTTQYNDLVVSNGPSTTLSIEERDIDTFYFQGSVGAGLSFKLTAQSALKIEADARLLDIGELATSARALLAFHF